MKDEKMNTQEQEAEQNFAFKGIWIPSEACANPNLTPIAQKLFGILLLFPHHSKQPIWASNRYLSSLLGTWEKPVNLQTITNAIKDLRNQQYIITEYVYNHKKGKKERYIFINENYKEIYRSSIIKIMDLHNKNYGYPIIKIMNNIKRDSKTDKKRRETSFSIKGTDVPQGNNPDENKISIPAQKKLLPIPKENKYISRWNSYKISIHKREHRNQGSQTYIRTSHILRDIEKGIFHNKRQLDPEFMKKHSITDEILSSPLSSKQIDNTLDKLRLLFMEGYWGHNKFNKTKDLPSLLYNNRSMSSMFYAVMCNDNLTQPNTERFAVQDDNEEITELFTNLFSNGNGSKLSSRDNKTLVYGVQELVQLHKQFKERVRKGRESVDPRGKFFQEFSYPYAFMERYKDFLKAWKDDVNIHPGLVKPDSWMWQKFLDEYLYGDLDIDLREDEE